MIDPLLTFFKSWQFSTHTESAMQDDIEAALKADAMEFEREVVLSSKDRIDFMVGGCGVECKVGGSKSDVLRQLSRYARHQKVESIVLVTTIASHRAIDFVSLNGKQIRVYWVGLFG
jgi:hypothetical protein